MPTGTATRSRSPASESRRSIPTWWSSSARTTSEGSGSISCSAFTIGVDRVVAAGEHGTPSGPQRTDPPAALALCQSLLDRDIDVAFSTDLQVDHGVSHAIQYLVPEGLPVVPLIVNVFGPPLPSLTRCLAVGEALRRAAAGLAGGRRVAVIGTGGLSHAVPFPDWRDPVGDDEEFLA
ncbi:MAG: hypothetical protein R2697_01225 [Ilumatobacteraceae bacterium]